LSAAPPAGLLLGRHPRLGISLTKLQDGDPRICGGRKYQAGTFDGTIMVADAIILMLFPAMMAFAASTDLLTMTISNRVSLILAGGFFALALICGMSVMAFAFFTQGWIGGGDAKLAAATALWLGFDHLLPYLVYASLFGGALTLALLQFRLAPLPAMLARQDWVQRLHRKDGGVPYGIALAAAALAVYPDTRFMAVVG
jgi:prepilin peptidase CpaA